MRQTLADALVGILQVVLAHQADVYLVGSRVTQFEEAVPRSQPRCLAHGNTHLAQDGGIESLSLHVHRHFVDAGQVFALYDALQINIAETCHFHPEVVVEMPLGPEDKDVGLYAVALQFLHRMLRGLGLQFTSGFQIRYIGEMHANGIAPQFPLHLTDSFQIRRTLNVADGAPDFGNDEIGNSRSAAAMQSAL